MIYRNEVRASAAAVLLLGSASALAVPYMPDPTAFATFNFGTGGTYPCAPSTSSSCLDARETLFSWGTASNNPAAYPGAARENSIRQGVVNFTDPGEQWRLDEIRFYAGDPDEQLVWGVIPNVALDGGLAAITQLSDIRIRLLVNGADQDFTPVVGGTYAQGADFDSGKLAISATDFSITDRTLEDGDIIDLIFWEDVWTLAGFENGSPDARYSELTIELFGEKLDDNGGPGPGPMPVPATALLLGLGLVTLSVRRRRRTG